LNEKHEMRQIVLDTETTGLDPGKGIASLNWRLSNYATAKFLIDVFTAI